MIEPLSRINVPATIDSLPACLASVHQCATSSGMDPKRVLEVEIAAEEALVNVIRHAYGDGEGDIELCCRLLEDQGLVIEIRDSGAPFDPLSRMPPDVTAGIAERSIGGLGILIMRKLANVISYRRESLFNVLTLRFDRQPPAADQS